jgi:hypothetical protein
MHGSSTVGDGSISSVTRQPPAAEVSMIDVQVRSMPVDGIELQVEPLALREQHQFVGVAAALRQATGRNLESLQHAADIDALARYIDMGGLQAIDFANVSKSMATERWMPGVRQTETMDIWGISQQGKRAGIYRIVRPRQKKTRREGRVSVTAYSYRQIRR